MTASGTPTRVLPRWTILSVTTLSSFMVALDDSNVVTIALPAISGGLSSGISLLGWVITGYILANAMFLLQSGKFGDRYGKKSVYLIGFATFGAASALCGVSQDVYQLIFFRVVQGVGASIMSATSYPLIFESFPPSERGSALGINSVAWAVGSVAGPLLGGLLAAIDWRLIFYINVPIAAAAILLGARRIPSRLNVRSELAGRLNVISSTLLAVTVAVVMLWLTIFDLRLALIGIVAFAGFGVSEAKSKNPLLNAELIRNRGFLYSGLGLGVMMTAFFSIPFIMSLYLQSVANLSPILAGAWIAPLPVALVFSNPIAGRLFDRMRRPALMPIVGALVLLGSCILLSSEMSATAPSILVAALLGVAGLGGGFIWSPTIASALKFSRAELRGVANGTVLTMLNIGFAASIAITVSVSASSLPASLVGKIYLGSLTGLTPAQAALFAQGLSSALLALSAVDFLGVLILLLLLREEGKRS